MGGGYGGGMGGMGGGYGGNDDGNVTEVRRCMGFPCMACTGGGALQTHLLHCFVCTSASASGIYTPP